MNIDVILKDRRHEIRFSIEALPSETLLDILETIRKDKKPDLLYRHSCHHGSCGSCGAMIDGKPRLLCLTTVGELASDTILLEPLAKMMEIEGIAVWPGSFFDALPETDYMRPAENEGGGSRLENCIECGVCVAACPAPQPFIGPAALAAVAVEMEKHPERSKEMKSIADSPEGTKACEKAFECSRCCPQGVAPGCKIAELARKEETHR